jgi:hypothetical protein
MARILALYQTAKILGIERRPQSRFIQQRAVGVFFFALNMGICAQN